jgi:hypothetical protein
MYFPIPKNMVPTLIDGMSIEEYVRSATQNLRNSAASMPGSAGGGISGAIYLGFNGNTGEYKLNKVVVDPKSLGRILVPEQSIYEGMVEWAGGSPLQKVTRPLRGVAYDPSSTVRFLK